jgi:hypothetical protein
MEISQSAKPKPRIIFVKNNHKHIDLKTLHLLTLLIFSNIMFQGDYMSQRRRYILFHKGYIRGWVKGLKENKSLAITQDLQLANK